MKISKKKNELAASYKSIYSSCMIFKSEVAQFHWCCEALGQFHLILNAEFQILQISHISNQFESKEWINRNAFFQLTFSNRDSTDFFSLQNAIGLRILMSMTKTSCVHKIS